MFCNFAWKSSCLINIAFFNVALVCWCSWATNIMNMNNDDYTDYCCWPVLDLNFFSSMCFFYYHMWNRELFWWHTHGTWIFFLIVKVLRLSVFGWVLWAPPTCLWIIYLRHQHQENIRWKKRVRVFQLCDTVRINNT